MLTLVRHGQTAANRGGLLQGHVDLALTELGLRQAAAAAEALTASEATCIVTSPLQRARQTADVIARRLGVPVAVDERLIEMDYGTWDERPLSEVDSQSWARWRSDPMFAPPGGESLRSVTERAVECALELLERPGVTIAVSHVSPIKALVAWSLGCDESVTWRMHLDVASITRIGLRSNGNSSENSSGVEGGRASAVYLASFNEVAPVAP